MRQYTHDELHTLIDSNLILKEKSDKVHTLSQTDVDERKIGKLKMMEIYAEVVICKQMNTAKEFVEKVFILMKQGTVLDTLCNECVVQKLCHSPLGNDYVCFCDEG